tara:strand:+ start:229 stop:2028 length:1800 start_codon:yes stop_codon:yes gene_type:complete
MTFFKPARARGLSAVAALLLSLAPMAAPAESGGFAIEVGPPADPFTPVRVDARVFGTATDPASGFVRGCQGFVLPQGDAALFEVTARMESLAFTGAGDGVVSMVLETPEGLYQCALADQQGLASAQLAGVSPGAYRVWMGGAQGAAIDARLIASDRPVTAVELFGLDVSALGEPRAGRHVFAATASGGRQELALRAMLYADSELRPLSPEYCPGYGRLDAPDAVVTLDRAQDQISLFAVSDRDLTMAVVSPDGSVICNDDAFELNPGVTINAAAAGDYQVFVGGYSQGGAGTFDLFASVGAPAFTNTVVNLEAAPRAGYAMFDARQAQGGVLLATAPVTSSDPMEMLPTGAFCPGFVDVSAPDFVLSLDGSSQGTDVSLYARSGTDLVLAVRAPDGVWTCNDDDFELNPAVRVQDAQPGDYLVYVGTYTPDDPGTFNLYAAVGEPAWERTDGGPMTAPANLDPGAEPILGRIEFGPETRIDPRIIFDVLPSETEAFGMGEGCAGFITPSQPDLVIGAQPGLPQLMVYMASDVDGTLVVVGPDGTLYCNDDFDQLNPGIMIPNAQQGDYAVFAGTYSGTGGLATLGVTIASPQWVMDREH